MLRRITFLVLILALVGFISSVSAKESKGKDPLKRRAFFGMGNTSLPDSIRPRIAPDSTGIYIIYIVPGRSADKLGLKKGDVLLKLNGITLRESGDVRKIVYGYKAGDKVTAEFWHDGKRMKATTTLTEYPRESSPDFDIVYDSFKDGDSLRRVIITKPKVAGKYPVVVLLPGVGAFDIDRNKDVFEYPLQNLLYSLTKAGFVTVRMDKPGQGDSQGPATASIDFLDELRFQYNGLKALANWSFVDTSRVILFAHSSGGYHAPALAQMYPVKGVIAINTPGIGWRQWDVSKFRREWTLDGWSPDTVEADVGLLDLGLNNLAFGDSVQVKTAMDNRIAKGRPTDMSLAYIRYLAMLNPPAEWKKVTAPVLVVSGTSDYISSVEETRAVADAVNYFHAGQATYVELKDLDHELRTLPTWKASYAMTNEQAWFGPTHPELSPIIIEWAKKTAGL